MRGWQVQYLDVRTRSVGSETRWAPNEEALRAALQAQGLQLLSVQAMATKGWTLGWTRPGQSQGQPAPPRPADLVVFCTELRSLVGAGLSVVESLEALAEVTAASRTGHSLPSQLLERLRAGRALSAAMKDVGGFPVLLVASVQASERTSHLTEALDAYLAFERMVRALLRRTLSAALYPGIVLALGALITVFLLVAVLPRFAALYGQMGGQASDLTRMVLSVSRFLNEAPWLVPGLVVLGVGAAWALARSRSGAAAWLAWLPRPPWLAKRIRDFELARLYEALALLMAGGYAATEALSLCEQTASSRALAVGVRNARVAVEEGKALSAALGQGGLTDAVSVRLLRAGERGGDFPRTLRSVAQRHAAEFETFVERATRLVEPLLLMAVSVLIGGLVILLYMPIFDIAGAVT
jgi:general secretion pathway protein F